MIVKGIVYNPSDAPVDLVVPELARLRTTVVRTWIDIDWARPPSSASLAPLRVLAARSVGLIATCHTAKPPPSQAVCDRWWTAAVTHAPHGATTWQIGNEVNLKKYAPQGIRPWLHQVWDPSVASLGQARILAPSISENPYDLYDLTAALVHHQVAGLCFHPYGKTVEDHLHRVANAHRLAKPLDLHLTEWNLHGPQPHDWARMVSRTWHQIRLMPRIASVCYYRGLRRNTGAAKAGIWLDRRLTPAPWFHAMYAGLA